MNTTELMAALIINCSWHERAQCVRHDLDRYGSIGEMIARRTASKSLTWMRRACF